MAVSPTVALGSFFSLSFSTCLRARCTFQLSVQNNKSVNGKMAKQLIKSNQTSQELPVLLITQSRPKPASPSAYCGHSRQGCFHLCHHDDPQILLSLPFWPKTGKGNGEREGRVRGMAIDESLGEAREDDLSDFAPAEWARGWLVPDESVGGAYTMRISRLCRLGRGNRRRTVRRMPCASLVRSHGVAMAPNGAPCFYTRPPI
jgi:hypothetical protein